MVLQSAYSLGCSMLLQSKSSLDRPGEWISLNQHRNFLPQLSMTNYVWHSDYLISGIHGNQTAWRERERVINANWDISAGLESDGVNATLEQCFWWSRSPICCTQEHICAQCPRRNPLAENTSVLQGGEGEDVRHCEHYYASRQQISILIAPQLY